MCNMEQEVMSLEDQLLSAQIALARQDLRLKAQGVVEDKRRYDEERRQRKKEHEDARFLKFLLALASLFGSIGALLAALSSVLKALGGTL